MTVAAPRCPAAEANSTTVAKATIRSSPHGSSHAPGPDPGRLPARYWATPSQPDPVGPTGAQGLLRSTGPSHISRRYRPGPSRRQPTFTCERAPSRPYGLVIGWWGIEHDDVTVSKHHRAPSDPHRTACRDPRHPHSGPSDIRREVRQEAWPPRPRVQGRDSPKPGRERHMPPAQAQGRSQLHSRQPAGSHSVCRSRWGLPLCRH
jgi:hypothetical protein